MSILDIDDNVNETPTFSSTDMLKLYLIDHNLYKENEPISFIARKISYYEKDHADKYGIFDDDIIIKCSSWGFPWDNNETVNIYESIPLEWCTKHTNVIWINISNGIKRRLTWKMVKDYFQISLK